MRTKIFAIILTLLLISLIIFGFLGKKSKIEIDYENSFYSEYSIKEDKVYIECELVINNTTNKQKNIQITGTFDNDVSSGLLKNPTIYGYNSDLKTNIFEINSGSQRIKVIFIGDYNGVNIKHDRKLPKIQLIF